MRGPVLCGAFRKPLAAQMLASLKAGAGEDSAGFPQSSPTPLLPEDAGVLGKSNHVYG